MLQVNDKTTRNKQILYKGKTIQIHTMLKTIITVLCVDFLYFFMH